jgi:MYXO-CTERM domain-containing protein
MEGVMSAIRYFVAAFFGLAVGQQASVASAAPATWTCDEAAFADGVCDCGCGADDTDCEPGSFVVCERSGCPANAVPWEHSPSQCMRSACGDGWRDEAKGEVCDDAEGLAGGGCNADCSAVNPGWTCGDLAAQCTRAPVEADQGVEQPDLGAPDAAATADAGAETDAAAIDQPRPDAGAGEADQGDGAAGPGGDEKSSDAGCSTTESSAPSPDSALMVLAFGLIGLARRRRTR